MNRRKFFKRVGLVISGAAAAAGVAIVGLPILPALAKTWKVSTPWRGGLIDLRAIARLSEPFFKERAKNIGTLIQETNDILADMKWKEGDKYK